MIQLVAEFLAFQHQCEGRIARDIDRFDRIHLKGDAQAHCERPLLMDRPTVILATRWRGAAASGGAR